MNNLTQEQKVSIYFVMDNEDYAFKNWFHVPSVGDEVMLSDNKVYRVVRRCWVPRGVRHIGQVINIEIEAVDDE